MVGRALVVTGLLLLASAITAVGEGAACECPLCGQEATFENTPEGVFRKYRLALLTQDASLLREALVEDPNLHLDAYVKLDHPLLSLVTGEVKASAPEGDHASVWVEAKGKKQGEMPCLRKDGVWRLDLMQGLIKARGEAIRRDCVNNLRQLGTYMVMWTCKYGNDRIWPGPGLKLVVDLFAHPDPASAICRGNKDLFLCKATTDTNTAESVQKGDPDCTSYEITETKMSDAETTPDTPIMWDKTPVHDGWRNVLFFSGAVKTVHEEDFQALMKKFGK